MISSFERDGPPYNCDEDDIDPDNYLIRQTSNINTDRCY